MLDTMCMLVWLVSCVRVVEVSLGMRNPQSFTGTSLFKHELQSSCSQ